MKSRTSECGSRRVAVMVVVTTLVAVLGGCGGSGSTKASAPTVGSEEFGLTLEQLTVKIEQTEASIGRCMSTAGFVYVPLDYATVKKAMDSDQSAPGRSDEQYVAQYGFGITTQLDKPIVAFGAGPQNAKALSGLSATDSAAYRRALWGDEPSWTLVRAIEQEDFAQTQGCTKTAALLAFPAETLSGSYVNPGDKLVAADKRMIDALKKWSDCMRKAGFTYENPNSIEADLRERFAVIAKGQDLRSLFAAPSPALKALQGEELAVARAHVKCFEDNVQSVEAKVEAEIYGSRKN